MGGEWKERGGERRGRGHHARMYLGLRYINSKEIALPVPRSYLPPHCTHLKVPMSSSLSAAANSVPCTPRTQGST